jgi:hypothetical protein
MMNQIIWMINFIPDIFWTMVVVSGILAILASYFLGKLAFVSQYKLPLRIGGVLALLVGIYAQGIIANEALWQARTEELKKQVATAEEAAKTANTELSSAIDEKRKVEEKKTKEVVKYIDKWKTKEILTEVAGPERVRVEEVIKYIENCPVPKEMLEIHNKGAQRSGDKK